MEMLAEVKEGSGKKRNQRLRDDALKMERRMGKERTTEEDPLPDVDFGAVENSGVEVGVEVSSQNDIEPVVDGESTSGEQDEGDGELQLASTCDLPSFPKPQTSNRPEVWTS